VVLLETSPLLSYLFFSHVVSAKATSDSPVSDHSEELTALKLRSEKLESELATAQAALTEAHDLVESLREEVQQMRADMVEGRSREAAVLEGREKEKEDLRKEAQTYKSEGDALRKTMADQQLDVNRTKQRYIADNAALQTRFDELQQRFDELSKRQEVVVTPMIVALEENAVNGAWQSPEQPSTPTWGSQHVPQTLTLMESPTIHRPGSPEVPPLDPPTPQFTPMSRNIQVPDQSPSPVRLSRSQKFKAKRAAKKQAQENQGEPGVHSGRVDVLVEAP